MALGADDGAGCSVEILSLLLELVLIREVNLTGELGSLVSGNMAEYDGLDEELDRGGSRRGFRQRRTRLLRRVP